ncbi:inositol monophosphatase family protein [Vagococcus salmoninarum]|uniref:Inositol monophosphatase n=1 Tax=Vagococcus salmoninarum TaxID=2739 RepID=A0A429ZWG9_9ENTE|nr:inositol monophosphatase family protein [Vagococcus salmoninarum]RST98015.1 inositol monophosphatase [Vagococcus salmoninarum]
MTNQKMAEEIKSWIYEAAESIKIKLQSPLIVEEKSNHADLVTNVDKETEAFFVKKIRENYPDDQILGEEGLGDEVTDFKGRVWIIDPIDGTLNFVKQQDNFCTMLAVFEDGVGQLGFIYEIMRDELVWGGRGIGVHLNDEPLKEPENIGIKEGIISVNTAMFLKDKFQTQNFSMEALAVRMTGCAGIGFKELLKGNQNAYISYLQPWDYAPGKVLSDELGIELADLRGEALDLRQKVPLIAATPKTLADYQKHCRS